MSTNEAPQYTRAPVRVSRYIAAENSLSDAARMAFHELRELGAHVYIAEFGAEWSMGAEFLMGVDADDAEHFKPNPDAVAILKKHGLDWEPLWYVDWLRTGTIGIYPAEGGPV